MTDNQAGPHPDSSPPSNWLLAGALWGPGLFILAWVVSGLLVEGYSPIADHISELAGVNSPTQLLMTSGLAAYAIGVGTSAWPLRKILGTSAATALALNAFFTFGIVLTPSGRSSFSDLLHGGFAFLLYLFLSLAGLLSYSALHRPSRAWSIFSVTAGLLTGAFLAWSLGSTNSGLFQRLGFTTADLWLMATGWAVMTGRLQPGRLAHGNQDLKIP